jgi:hypothetical protein
VTENANEIPGEFFALLLLNMLMEQRDGSRDNVQLRNNKISIMKFSGLEQYCFWLPVDLCPLSDKSRKPGS